MPKFAPLLFVLIWSTGFVVARAVTPHAAPELFLTVRMLLSAGLLGSFAVMAGESLPRGRRLAIHLLAGALLNGIYLCSSWWAVQRGLPAGVMALLGALQPLVVAIASVGIFRERLSAPAWAGLGIGLTGVSLVVAPLILLNDHATIPLIVLLAAFASILAMAAGTMIQRGAIGGDPMRISGAVQNLGGAIVAGFAMMLLADYRWDNAYELWLGLGWSVIGLSIGGLSLLVWMTRNQGATRVSVLLLLVPPLAALEAWLLFGEHLVAIQLVGFALALTGVIITRLKSDAVVAR